MITSKDNAQVKKICAYQMKKKERDADGVFVAEGERLVTEAPADALVSLYVTASYRDAARGDAKRFLDAHADITETVSDDVMRKMSDVDTPQGILAIVRQRKESLPLSLPLGVESPGDSQRERIGAPGATATRAKKVSPQATDEVSGSSAASSSDVSASLRCAGHSIGSAGPDSMAQKSLTGNHTADGRGDVYTGSRSSGTVAPTISPLLEERVSPQATGEVSPIFLLLDNIQDTGNLGTILRSSEAAGTSAVFLTKDCVDIYNPKVVRATMGAIYRVPFIRLGHTHTAADTVSHTAAPQTDASPDGFDSLQDAISLLRQNGVTLCAADMAGTVDYDRADLTEPVCFLIGNEGNGLSKEVRDAADIFLRIPMAGKSESLNAAVAASVLLFEAARQRRGREVK